MAKTRLTHEEAAELRRLNTELVNALQRVTDALHTEAPGHALEGEALARVEAAEKTVAAIQDRIKAIRHG